MLTNDKLISNQTKIPFILECYQKSTVQWETDVERITKFNKENKLALYYKSQSLITSSSIPQSS